MQKGVRKEEDMTERSVDKADGERRRELEGSCARTKKRIAHRELQVFTTPHASFKEWLMVSLLSKRWFICNTDAHQCASNATLHSGL
jgi:hypothetical protein